MEAITRQTDRRTTRSASVALSLAPVAGRSPVLSRQVRWTLNLGVSRMPQPPVGFLPPSTLTEQTGLHPATYVGSRGGRRAVEFSWSRKNAASSGNVSATSDTTNTLWAPQANEAHQGHHKIPYPATPWLVNAVGFRRRMAGCSGLANLERQSQFHGDNPRHKYPIPISFSAQSILVRLLGRRSVMFFLSR